MSSQLAAAKQVQKKKRMQYSPSKLKLAIDMVKSGAMSRKKASLTYGIPRTTLIDKLSGRSPESARPGPSTVLTPAEERTLVDYCNLMSSIGYPLRRQELLIEVKKILDHDGRVCPFKNNLPGKDWFYAFKRRNPDLTERKPMSLGHQRAVINIDMIKAWFQTLLDYLKNEVTAWNDLVKDPRRIFNADETGFPLSVSSSKVLAPTGARNVYQVVTGNKTQLTVMACFNAMGQYVPPLIVYPGERFRDIGISSFPEAIFGHSSSGWMDSDLFVAFLGHLSEFVLEHCIPKPVILFVDGHSTHLSLAAARFCAENGIVLYCLLPNATHVLQSCDIGFFSPMKSAWKKEVKAWQLQHIGESLTKKAFPEVFKKAWVSVATFENAASAFKRCGLFPLTPEGVNISKLAPSKVANPQSSASDQNPTASESKLENAASIVSDDSVDAFTLPSAILPSASDFVLSQELIPSESVVNVIVFLLILLQVLWSQ